MPSYWQIKLSIILRYVWKTCSYRFKSRFQTSKMKHCKIRVTNKLLEKNLRETKIDEFQK